MDNFFPLAAILVFVCPSIRAMEIPTAQSDVTISNDRFELRSGDSGSMVTVGDFNGDGYDDFALSLLNTDGVETEVDLVLSGTSPSGLVQGTALRILTPIPASQRGFHQIGFGDIDNDGKDDLFIAMENVLKPGVAILFGRTLVNGNHETIDLTTSNPDVMLEGGFINTMSADVSFAFADFTGDGISDVAVGLPFTDGDVYLIPGRTRGSFTPVIDVSTDPLVRLIKGPSQSNFGTTVFMGNVIGDGTPDLIISAPRADFSGRMAAGKIFIIDGHRVLPPIWDMQTSTITADIEIGGGTPGFFMSCSGLGNMNGDGLDDLLIDLNLFNSMAVLDGSHLTPHPLIDLNPTSPNYVAPAPVSINFNEAKGVGGDFDGDGRSDFFIARTNAIQLFASSAVTDWPSFPASFDTPWIIQSETGYLRKAAFGDFNGDGLDDLVIVEEAHGDSWGAIHTIYGFKPLVEPSLHVREQKTHTSKVTVDLGVSGDPTEMRLSGNIVDSFKDQWIPYGTSQEVTLSPAVGSKKVEVVFRNAFHRESGLTSDTTTLAVGESDTEIETNLVDTNQLAHFKVPLTTPGRFKAVVFTRMGQKVTTLIDEDRAPGLWPVEWDGTNVDGRRVAPGVYILSVDAGERHVKEKILVKE